MASVRITFAESQLVLNSDRLAKPGTPTAGRTLPGGTVPFGRILVRAEPDGWRLAPDPEYAAVVAGLVRR